MGKHFNKVSASSQGHGYQVVNNVAPGRAAATVTKPLPRRGAEYNTCRVMYPAVGTRM